MITDPDLGVDMRIKWLSMYKAVSPVPSTR